MTNSHVWDNDLKVISESLWHSKERNHLGVIIRNPQYLLLRHSYDIVLYYVIFIFFQLLYNRKLTPSLNRKRIGGRLIKYSETFLSVNKYLFVGSAGSLLITERTL